MAGCYTWVVFREPLSFLARYGSDNIFYEVEVFQYLGSVPWSNVVFMVHNNVRSPLSYVYAFSKYLSVIHGRRT